MRKAIKSDVLKTAITEYGLTQGQLAEQLNVSSQAVTNWIKGKDFPRPATLLKLASIFKLTFEQLVVTNDPGKPIVAFRKKGNAKTNSTHYAKAEAVGMLLKPLVEYLPEQQALRTQITSPSMDYHKLQLVSEQTRNRLGIGAKAELKYEDLIGEFKECGAILIPVMWGKQHEHKNALHIRLPVEDVTFIFINLDTYVEDFKFWMAHELAHVYTPDLAGTVEGEDYADAYAGTLLFPIKCAKEVYHQAIGIDSPDDIITYLLSYADEHLISLNTVYEQVNQYAKNINAPALPIDKKHLHIVRNSTAGPLVSEALYDPMPPAPDTYLASCEKTFQSDFFHALKLMIHEQETGSSYLQQILDVSVYDAKALYEELRH